MRSGGVLLAVAGVWVLCQVLGGNALERLGLVKDPADEPIVKPGDSITGGATVPDLGYSQVPHDAQGRPLN